MTEVDRLEDRALDALRQALASENLACYFDGSKGTRDAARRAHDAAEAAIEALAVGASERNRDAFLAGFRASGEGFNGEHPFEGVSDEDTWAQLEFSYESWNGA